MDPATLGVLLTAVAAIPLTMLAFIRLRRDSREAAQVETAALVDADTNRYEGLADRLTKEIARVETRLAACEEDRLALSEQVAKLSQELAYVRGRLDAPPL